MSNINYFFNVPVSQWDVYIKYIIEGIYGVKDDKYTVTHEFNGIRRIKLNTNPQIPLINSLPITIKLTNFPIIHYENSELIDKIGITIRNAIEDYCTQGGHYYKDATIIHIKEKNLKGIIFQLAREGKITRFGTLANNQFIVSIYPYPVTVLVKCSNGILFTNIYADVIRSTFDIDDGYTGILKYMNSNWISWKENDDLTAPIQPPNYV